MVNLHGLSESCIESIAGFTAGTAATLATHPLDIIKTRLQINAEPRAIHPLSNAPISASHKFQFPSFLILRNLLNNEGGSPFRSLYRGLTPNLVGNSLGWSLYFLWYSQAQDVVRYSRGYSDRQPLSALDYLAASLSSGLLSSALTNPIWVVKTRMLSTSAQHTGAYPSMLFGLRAILREEGWRGYFHGLVPTLAGVSHGAIYFVAYEKLKAWRFAIYLSSQNSGNGASQDGGKRLKNTDYVLLSGIAKVLAGILTYPHQVLRARIQTHHLFYHRPPRNNVGTPSVSQISSPLFSTSTLTSTSNSQPTKTLVRPPNRLVSTICFIWHQDGLVGFYRGLGPNLLRVVPSTCITFLVYENVRWVLREGGLELAEV